MLTHRHSCAAVTFDTYSKLPADLVPTSKQVMLFSGRCVKVTGDAKWFDWESFLKAINTLNGDFHSYFYI
jgi:hypothetical protein